MSKAAPSLTGELGLLGILFAEETTLMFENELPNFCVCDPMLENGEFDPKFG